MPWYASFLLGILSGIITSIIATFIINTFDGFRKIIPPKLRKSFDREFKNQDKAVKSILKDADNSTFVCVFAMKGSSFCGPLEDEEGKGLTRIFHNKNIEQKYLISSLSNPYLQVRKRELSGGTALDLGVQTSHVILEEACKDQNRKVHFRQHQEIVRFRLIIFDDALYISFQPKDQRGRTSPMQRYPKNSSGYVALKAFFDEKWDEYKNTDYM